ncbi:MAG TPA: glycerol-3-phosphate dehydrogenase [Stellaceae bacterium]|nr:glycerol-3-phosphate dehydrogenase [Stellaceae bacterium]
MPEILDILVVGGGINGVGIARDAAGRGLAVQLVEREDLGGATSSASSKLIHGGLRYLEHGAFRLVREALTEREVLFRSAPHLIRPLRFVLPYDRGLRPRALLRLGLFLYDHIGGRRTLPGSETVALRVHPYGDPLQARLSTGFAYSDCRVDDARLVVLNARDGAARGARIMTRTEMRRARRRGDHWRITIERDGRTEEVAARILVNAAGPWAGDVLRRAGVARPRAALRLIKGGHIVVPRLYDGAQAYILQNDDGRVVFVLPFEEAFSLIGTTEIPVADAGAGAAIDPAEIAYLCRAVSHWFARPVAPRDAVWSYAGIRPLYDDGKRDAAAVTRDYVLDLDAGAAPLLSVFGGKITTYRRLAEQAMAKLAPFLPGLRGAWTAGATLPGGDLPDRDIDAYAAGLARDYPFLEPAAARRLARSYGSDARRILGSARRAEDLGRGFGCGFSERELDWLVAEEWARSAEDVLWRRSKLGLHLDRNDAAAIAALMAGRRAVAPPIAPNLPMRRQKEKHQRKGR